MLQGWQIIDIYVLFVWDQCVIENQWSFNRLEFPYVFSEWDFQWNYDVVWCCVHIIMGKKGATYEFLKKFVKSRCLYVKWNFWKYCVLEKNYTKSIQFGLNYFVYWSWAAVWFTAPSYYWVQSWIYQSFSNHNLSRMLSLTLVIMTPANPVPTQ